MPLTPEDVSNKRFTPVRLREGYDMSEVDQFLDEVETELERLIKENDDLRSKLQAAQRGGGTNSASVESTTPVAAPASTPPPAPRPPVEEKPKEEPPAPAAPAPVSAPVTPAAVGSSPQEIKVTTVADASSAAARLLEIATHNADQVLTEAKDEADKIVGAARTKSERLEGETKAKTDRMESDARTRVQMLDTEIENKRREQLGSLEKQKVSLSNDIESLRAFEREYRSRLRGYFTQQLAALDGNAQSAELPNTPEMSDEHAPKRLKSILGDEAENKR